MLLAGWGSMTTSPIKAMRGKWNLINMYCQNVSQSNLHILNEKAADDDSSKLSSFQFERNY